MLIAGHTEDTIRQALDAANERHDGNLAIRQLERHGKTGRSKYLDIRITVKQTRDKDGEILPGVHTTRRFGRSTQDIKGYRANAAASWDAHGEFMLELYRINPDTIIRAGSIANGGVVLKSRDDLRNHWR
jgi:hypothetical protein